ncbi:centrosome-associated protein 350-like [Periplaneta americana]|uniref:centrosome-associated protein 350-like n=1 Tax=Periplaneta americana TaxID=6978 RepID=UPI0037E71F2C
MNDFDDISEQFQHLKQMSYEQHHCQSLNAPNHSKIGDKDLVQESSDENHIECLLLHSSLHSLNMSTQISEGQNEASRTTKEIYLKALDETNSNLKVRNDFQLKNPFLINSDNETKEDNLPKRNMKVKKNVSRALKGLHLKFPDDSNKDKQLLLNSGLRNPSIVDDHTEMKENNLPEYNIKVKKDISKALKGMNLKVSNHDASMLQVTNDLQLKASYDVKQQDGLREHDIIVRKEVTKALKELMETGKKQELAAIKIQAAFRGYQTRKLLNVKVKSPDEYIFLKSIKKNSKEEPCPNRPVHIRSHVQSLNNDNRFKKTTNSTAFHSTSVSGNDFMERLKSVYVESYPYNMMTAIQNTMLSRSSPGQLYWVQANCTPKLTKEQTVPVIDASKGKMKKRLSIHQFAHSSKTNRKEYESSIISDNDSIQEESSLLDDNYFSSDESGMRRKKRFNIKSSGDLLPSRVKPACWSKSDSEIIVRHSASSKSRMKPHNSSWKEYIEKNIRLSASSISQGKPAIMPKRGKYSDCGLVAPNVELRRKTERLSEMCSDAENSGNDAWDRRIVHHQPTSYSPIFSTAPETAFKSYRKGHSSRDATKPVYSAGVLQSGVTAVLDDRNKEKIQNNYNCKIRERILAQMSAITPSTTSFASAVESEHVSENGDSQTMKKFDVLVEDKQVQAEPVSKALTCNVHNVQTQTFVRDQSKEFKSINKAVVHDTHSNSATGHNKKIQMDYSLVEPRVTTQKVSSSQSVRQSLFPQQKMSIQVSSNNHKFESIPHVASQTTASVTSPHEVGEIHLPQTSIMQTKSDRNLHIGPSQTPVLLETKREVKIAKNPVKIIPSQPTENNMATDRVSDCTEDTIHPVVIDQLLQASKNTRRLITVQDKETRETLKRRREELVEELNVKCRKWDTNHKKLINEIEREDNEHLKQILLGNIDININPEQLCGQVDIADGNYCDLNVRKSDLQNSSVHTEGNNDRQVNTSFCKDVLNSSAHKQLLMNVNYRRGAAEVLPIIKKDVMDLEKMVTENIEDTTAELSFQTISEEISEEDTSSSRTRNNNIQDMNLTQTSYISDISVSKLNESEKLSKIKKSLIKIDKLIQEEKESAQRHIDLLNEKFKLLKERTKADMKLIQMEIRTHIGEGDEYLVPALKKQSSLVKNLEQVKAENKREYERLVRATMKRKHALRQQKALIKSYLKSVQSRGRNLQEDHRSRSSLSDDDNNNQSILSASATHVDLPSVLPSIEDVEESSSTHESESYNLSEFMPVRDQEKFSEEALILPDTSLKQDQNSVDKFNSYEEITDTPLTESGTDIIALERRVEGLHEQLRKKKHEAEKLSREYQMKKKQQLRNKEQILLKQLQEYDAYISKTRKELEDSRDNLTDTSSLSENVLYDNKIELSPSCDTIKQLSERKVLEQKENREEEGKSDTGQSVNLQSSGTIESSQQISSKDVTSKKSILQGQSKELRELSSTGYVSLELEIQNGFSENSNVETVPHCFVIRPSSVNSRQQNIPVKKDLEEEFEVIEQMEDIPENLEGQSNMQKSITCTQNFETIINEFLNKSDYVIEDVFDEKLESKSIIERSTGVKHDSEFDVRGLSEENHDSESSIQELTEAKHDAGFDVQECIEKKCDLGSDIQGLIEEKCDSEYHIQELIEENDTTYSVIQELTERKGDDSESVTQESLDKFESKSSIPNLLHSKEEPSIHDERLDSISLIDELVISKGQSYIQEFEESLEEEESIPKETEMEEENDFVTRIEEDSVRSASGQNLKEQLSPSFTDKNYGAVNILEDSICDIVHNVFKQEESDNAEGEIAGKEEENSQNDIRKLEEFFKVKRSESPSPVSEVSKTLLRKEVEENICGRDIDKMEGEHDEKLSKEVERITDILFKNLLNESLKTFDLKGTAFDANEIHYKREFEDQLTNDSEVHDRRDQLTESTEKEAVINEKQDKTVKNVHNITNPILELLDEPSVLLHSKKTTRDSFLCSEEKNEEAAAVEDLETTGLPRSELQGRAVDVSAVSKEWQKQQKVALGLSTNGDSAENGFDLSCQEWFDEDTRRIAEELRLQQLQIEQEIQELEQAQEQLPYFYIREIPNKPPPPYTPPNQQTWTQTTPCSSPPSMPTIKQDLTEEEPRFTTADELHSLTVEVIGYLYDALTTGVNLEIVEAPLEFYDDPDTVNASDFKKHSRKVFKKLVFDLTRDLVKEAYGWERDKPCAPWDWLAFAHKRRKVFPPKSKEMLQETVVNQVSTLFGFSSKTYKEKLVIRWSRKKRDFVDEILIKESHEEESSWTNYDQDEITVKNEITVGILNSLLDESIQIFTAIRNKKLKKL